MLLTIIVSLVISYLIGSIPTSIIVGKVLRGIDIRDHGSGNAGATNVYRVLGLGPAIFVSIIDVAKGASVILLVSLFAGNLSEYTLIYLRLLAGCAAVCGHVWTVFAGFRGGKGVNTAAGVLIGIVPVATLVALLVWIILTLTTRYVSVGSISAAITLLLVLVVERYLFDQQVPYQILIFTSIIVAIVIFAHRSNIRRLINGTENRFGKK